MKEPRLASLPRFFAFIVAITNHLKEYRDGGLTASLEDRFYRPSSSLAPFYTMLEVRLSAK